MESIKGWIFLHLTECKYRQFLKEMGIYISFKKDINSGARKLVKHQVVEKLGLSYALLGVKHALINEYISFKPIRRIYEVNYFSLVYEEFRDQMDTFSFSSNKTQKRFFQFVKCLDHLVATGYQNQINFTD